MPKKTKFPFPYPNLSNIKNKIKNNNKEEKNKVNCGSSSKNNSETIDFFEYANLRDKISISNIFEPFDLNSTMPQENANNVPNNNTAITTTVIFDSLRVPDAIKDLPHFDGNQRLLFEFLNNVEEILALIQCTSGTAYGKLLLRAIRNKITGPANEVLNMYGTPLDWEQIKSNLILHYSDKRNETSLIRDLHGLKQGNKTVQNYYSEIIEILATMTNNIQIHETNENVVRAKKDLYTEMCLNVFLSGLKEPLGSTIRAMRPGNLATAFSYCIKEQNISYTRFETTNSQRQGNIPRQNLPPRNFPNPQNSQNRPQFTRNFTNNFQSNRQFPQHILSNRNSNFNTFNRNYPQNTSQNRPEPMDVSTGSTIQKRFTQPTQYNQTQSNFSRQPNQQRYTNRELFNISSDVSPNPINNVQNGNFQELDQYYNANHSNDSQEQTSHEIDEGNFHFNASQPLSDT